MDYLPGTPPRSFGRSASSANVTRAAGNPVAAPGVPTTEEIPRAAERMGWQQPRPIGVPHLPRRDDSRNNSYCKSCRVIGHSKANCWQGMICDRCHQTGHPTRLCMCRPCSKCGDGFHREGLFADYKTLKAVRELVRQGALRDVPEGLLQELLQGSQMKSETSLND
ncbi:hypothetical protein JG687_00014698 [Phytophthora cactorum]|uniref:Uncharacterized protein n=1 Tax=Phytophthora cactorum TaxID=29920 RepID=A0A8T1TY27_9STRA|nr:hypothetical protein JG687_00014698 [Phytophthora cactorum]